MNNFSSLCVCVAIGIIFFYLGHVNMDTSQSNIETNSIQIRSIVNMRDTDDYEVVCNEFGVAYYKSPTRGEHYVYTPVFSESSHLVVTCEEYVNYLSK